MQTNMLRRSQLNWVFEVVKLILLVFSGYLTYGFLSRFLPGIWFRVLALVLFEGSLVFWHYVHHYRSETPRQHMFSKNMQRLALTAITNAAGYQLLTLVSAGFGDAPPNWTHFVVEITTCAIFLLNVWAFMHWEQLSRYYAAVEHSYNRELATGQTGMIQAALSQESSVKVVEADEKLTPPASAQDADVVAIAESDMTRSGQGKMVVQKLLNVAKRPAKLEDRTLALELLTREHPSMSVAELSRNTGLSPATVRRWQKEGK